MKFYLAPMEGITGYIFRNAYHTYFRGMDKYFTPFIKPNQKGHFSSKEKNDICPEHNQDMKVVPQILTNSAEDFIKTAWKLRDMGYDEINLNLGCPARTVVSKGRGSGFLAEPELLDRFLEEIFTKAGIKISIKTRIGKDDPEEFGRLLEIYNRYPLEELIIHPRVQQDFYKNTPNLEVYAKAVRLSRHPLCYNGDICSKEDYRKICERFPQAETVMIGRGILTNPGLLNSVCSHEQTDKQRLRAFHDQIYRGYQEVMSGERNVLFKMKELWFYLNQSFKNSDKYAKKIRKADRLAAYEEVVDTLFREQEICSDGNSTGLFGQQVL